MKSSIELDVTRDWLIRLVLKYLIRDPGFKSKFPLIPINLIHYFILFTNMNFAYLRTMFIKSFCVIRSFYNIKNYSTLNHKINNINQKDIVINRINFTLKTKEINLETIKENTQKIIINTE